MDNRVSNQRQWLLRSLLGACLLAIILLQGTSWPVVEAESSHVSLSEPAEVRQWMTDKLGVREDMFTFRFQGDTGSLTKLLSKVMDEALYSDPFIRYNVSRYTFQWKGTEDEALVTVYVEYRETYEQYKYVRQEAKRIVSTLMPTELIEADKVRWLHDYVITHVAYDESMTTFTAYEALKKGITVCQGYALLMQALLEEARIPSIVVEGQAGGTLHAWNMVQIDNSWFHVDATWDDPVPDKPNSVQYNYFMLSDMEMQADHEWDTLKTPKADMLYMPTR